MEPKKARNYCDWTHSMRTTITLLILLSVTLVPALAQGPPLNATPEQLFEQGMNAISGSSVNRNDSDAVEYFRRSAQKGYAPAQVVLGYFYDTGTLVAGDQSEAADWYRKAADQGDPLAQWSLGRLYFLGNGLHQDYKEAERWLKPAADNDNPFAAYLLGRVMQDRDYTKAPEYFLKAARQGLPQAQYRYAVALKDGRGVPQDRFKAYVWFLIAVDGSYSTSVINTSDIESTLTTDQIDRAKAKARALEQTVSRSVAAHHCCTGWIGEFDDVPLPPPPKLQRFCR
jgi:TPR repeat protein